MSKRAELVKVGCAEAVYGIWVCQEVVREIVGRDNISVYCNVRDLKCTYVHGDCFLNLYLSSHR